VFLLLALLAWLFLVPTSTSRTLSLQPVPHRTLTQADSGRTVPMSRSGDVTLRLSHRWRWTEPRLRGSSIQLQRVDYIRDPGFDEWRIEPVRNGTTTITARGVPGKRFRLTVRVG